MSRLISHLVRSLNKKPARQTPITTKILRDVESYKNGIGELIANLRLPK
ncbi:MAG: hypothetical protein AAF298_17260 [Cyanobacteria bacterium P01_A01_bin.40]